MKTFLPLLAIVLLVNAIPTAAEPGGKLILNGETEDCALFRALNGSEAVPDECKDSDTKSAFGARPKPPEPVILDRITFDFNSNQLTQNAQTDLSRVAKIMRNPVSVSQVYRLDGHTDLKGDPTYNLKLSKRRAAAVRKYLVSIGVPGNRLDSEGFGSQKLADPDHPYDLANRRVEIVNLSQGGN